MQTSHQKSPSFGRKLLPLALMAAFSATGQLAVAADAGPMNIIVANEVVATGVLSGPTIVTIPQNSNITLSQTSESRAATENLTLQASTDGGATWVDKETQTPYFGQSWFYDHTVVGVVQVRVKFVQKTTGVETYSNVITQTAQYDAAVGTLDQTVAANVFLPYGNYIQSKQTIPQSYATKQYVFQKSMDGGAWEDFYTHNSPNRWLDVYTTLDAVGSYKIRVKYISHADVVSYSNELSTVVGIAEPTSTVQLLGSNSIVAPGGFSAETRQTSNQTYSTGAMVWQESLDNGETWTDKFAGVPYHDSRWFPLAEPGSYQYRVKYTNKFTAGISYSNTVAVTATSAVMGAASGVISGPVRMTVPRAVSYLNLKQTQQEATATKEVTWQKSIDGGQTWTNDGVTSGGLGIGNSGIDYLIDLPDPGTYKYRARFTHQINPDFTYSNEWTVVAAMDPVGGTIDTLPDVNTPAYLYVRLIQTPEQAYTTKNLTWQKKIDQGEWVDIPNANWSPMNGMLVELVDVAKYSYRVKFESKENTEITYSNEVSTNATLSKEIGGFYKLALPATAPSVNYLYVSQNAAQRNGIESIKLQKSMDNGATWTDDRDVQPSAYGPMLIEFPVAGSYSFRLKVAHKGQPEVTYSDTISHEIAGLTSIPLNGASTALPGSTVTITADLSSFSEPAQPVEPTGFSAQSTLKTAAVVNPTDYNIEWSVYAPGSEVPVKTLGQTSVTVAAPDNQLVMGDYRVVLKAGLKSMASAEAVVTSEKVVSFNVKAPVVNVRGVALVESGKPFVFSGLATPNWTSRDNTKLKLAGRWLLDGQVIGEGPLLSYTFAKSTTPSAAPRDAVVTFESWVDGLESATKASKDFAFKVYDYSLPSFVVKAKVDSYFAPANLNLSLASASKTDTAMMAGKKYTFQWTLPEGLTGVARGGSAISRIDVPGTYDFVASVVDNLGNTQEYPYSITIENMKPYVFSLVTKQAIPFARDPMTYSLRPSLVLGHPKDRVKLWSLSVNDVAVGVPSSRMPNIVRNLGEGEHTIKLDFETNMGVTGSASSVVSVAANQPPALSLMASAVPRSTYAKVAATLSDVDGKIRSLKWAVDGVPSTKTSSVFLIDMKNQPAVTISATVTDDSGAQTTREVVVNGQ